MLWLGSAIARFELAARIPVPENIATRHWPARIVAIVIFLGALFPIVECAARVARIEGGKSTFGEGLANGRREWFVVNAVEKKCSGRMTVSVQPGTTTKLRLRGAVLARVRGELQPLSFNIRANVSEFRLLKLLRGKVVLGEEQTEIFGNASHIALIRDGTVEVMQTPQPLVMLNGKRKRTYFVQAAPSFANKLRDILERAGITFTRAQKSALPQTDICAEQKPFELPAEVEQLLK
jgi:hypothetical protein